MMIILDWNYFEDANNEIYFLEWNFLKNEKSKRILPKLKNGHVYKISSQNIRNIELMNSQCKSILCLFYSKILLMNFVNF